jgi:3-hydroxyacyl-[acyl-carrier protein] dehydratase / trans-2-decenoyl-[acyl-carrier protein] isomerase
MLMIDRITHISDTGGKYGKGEICRRARYHPRPVVLCLPLRRRSGHARLPGARCHVAAGRLSTWAGRATRPWAARWASGEVKFFGQVLPDRQESHLQHPHQTHHRPLLILGIADGTVSVDGREIYSAKACGLACSPLPTVSKGLIACVAS